jgi:hypothetical protein
MLVASERGFADRRDGLNWGKGQGKDFRGNWPDRRDGGDRGEDGRGKGDDRQAWKDRQVLDRRDQKGAGGGGSDRNRPGGSSGSRNQQGGASSSSGDIPKLHKDERVIDAKSRLEAEGWTFEDGEGEGGRRKKRRESPRRWDETPAARAPRLLCGGPTPFPWPGVRSPGSRAPAAGVFSLP